MSTSSAIPYNIEENYDEDADHEVVIGYSAFDFTKAFDKYFNKSDGCLKETLEERIKEFLEKKEGKPYTIDYDDCSGICTTMFEPEDESDSLAIHIHHNAVGSTDANMVVNVNNTNDIYAAKACLDFIASL